MKGCVSCRDAWGLGLKTFHQVTTDLPFEGLIEGNHDIESSQVVVV